MIELAVENWEVEVTNADSLVLVDWWGEACTDCIALLPLVEELEKTYGEKIKFCKFNTSQKGVRRFCIKHKILGLPVISIYKSGEKLAEISKEECTKDGIDALINKYL